MIKYRIKKSNKHNRLLQLSVEGEGRQIRLSEIASSAHNRQLKQAVVGLDYAFAPVIKHKENYNEIASPSVRNDKKRGV